MKVNDNSAANKPTRAGSAIDPAREPNAGAPVRKSSPTGHTAVEGGGTVTMSSDVEEVERISVAAQGTPEVRPEVVEQIKAELASGELDVDADLLAARLLQDMGWFAGSEE